MGIEAYGLIGFLMTSQAMLQILDFGLAPAVNREVARSTSIGDLCAARTLLHTLGRLYWLIAVVIGAVFFAAAPVIATTWLGTSQLPLKDVIESLMLMGVLIAARWPIAVYQNTLIGARRLATASLLQAAMSTVSVAASISVVTYLAPRPQALFATQAAVAIVHLVLVRMLAWRALGGHSGALLSLGVVKRVWQFSAGMGGVLLTSIALTQLDKALLSTLLPLAAFGEYMLAVTVVGGLSVLVGPLFNTIYPEFSALVAREQTQLLADRYHRDTRLFAIAFLPIAIALGVYGHDLIWLWTGSDETAAAIAPVVALLCIGSAVNGLMHFPYALQLAYGLAWIPLAINVALLVVAGPLIVVLTMAYGATGGAAAWAMVELVYLLIGTWVTHRHIAIGCGLAWLGKGIAMPLALTGALTWTWYPFVGLLPAGSALRASAIVASVLVTGILSAICFPDLRASLFAKLHATTPLTKPV
ncbi:MAG: polysaccharide biosynthesis protein [Burkholderiaceae bacterium]